MNDVLEYVIYFVGSGLAFFVGVACILASLAISPYASHKSVTLLRNVAAMFGGILVTISAAPLEWWLYALLAGITFVWLPLEWCQGKLPARMLIFARCTMFAVWLLALAVELPFHVTPALQAQNNPTLMLIGDSVSAGMSEIDKGTWPTLFAQQHSVRVIDCSKMGATAKSARGQAATLGEKPGLVLLEIGGNDLLGTTTAEQFEEQLDLLLAEVSRPNRTMVMLALPLPPLANRYGQIQRRLARKYKVILIPPRVLVGVLTTPGATVDGIHLTPGGHQRMADAMWDLLAPVYQ